MHLMSCSSCLHAGIDVSSLLIVARYALIKPRLFSDSQLMIVTTRYLTASCRIVGNVSHFR